MTDAELEKVFQEARDRVQVWCDDNHSHSALQGCLDAPSVNDPKDVLICKLCETIKLERTVMQDAIERFGAIRG